MRLLASPRFWTLLFVGAWSSIWVWAAVPFFSSGRVEVLWILGAFAAPSSLVLNALSQSVTQSFGMSHDAKLYIDIFGFLPFGWLQYGAVGYLLGKLLQRGYLAFQSGRVAQ